MAITLVEAGRATQIGGKVIHIHYFVSLYIIINSLFAYIRITRFQVSPKLLFNFSVNDIKRCMQKINLLFVEERCEKYSVKLYSLITFVNAIIFLLYL